ncbi:MAG: hypothetical protein WCW52_02310 [Elusimicrobiales bacterium]|jgi:tRNA A37 threonylcarbamoyladenosine modification protein TsaB
MAEKLTAGICTSGSRVKLSALAGGRFYNLSKKALNQEKVLFSMFDRLLGGLRPGAAARTSGRYKPGRPGHSAGQGKSGGRLAGVGTLCVITGPGRFTGLRVGLTLAGILKTLAGIRVYSSTLFDILAAQAAASKEFRTWAAGKNEPRIVALVHAFKDEYFCQAFQARGAGRPCEIKGLAAGSGSSAAGREPRPAGYKFVPACAPQWFKDTEAAGYLAAQGRDVYVIADAQEKADIYSLVPAGFGRAPARISKILPEFIIKTGLALKNSDLSPLYLKPAKYELDRTSFYADKKSSKRGPGGSGRP